MGDLILNCSLCCNKTFTSKELLLEHLASILDNIICPICNTKWPSLVQLIEHLSLDNCQTVSETQHIADSSYTITENFDSQIDDTSEANKMYVEILDKPTDIETSALKLIKQDGGMHYVIVPQDNELVNGDSAIVTKQNNDGTISLTTVKDIKTETEGLLNSLENTKDESQEQIYSCNTCEVSFSSVIEHIQNYHNNQDVVVEEPIEDDADSGSFEVALLDDDSQSSTDKQGLRRVITAAGDIVEETPASKPNVVDQDDSDEITEEIVKDVNGRKYTRRLVKLDKSRDSVPEPDTTSDKKVSYHKVAVREVQADGGNVLKLYTCMSCKVVAQDIDHFRNQPCKTMKYPCPHCPVAYHNAKSLCAHMKVHKSKATVTAKGKTTYECQICWTVFTSNKSLKLHKRMHDPVKTHPIELPVENTDGSEVSEERYHCSICDKIIPVQYKSIHQDSHKPSDMLNCSICNKKFGAADYLEMHMNVHNTDKVVVNNQDKTLPYSCLYCDRKFARPHEKVKHERIHTGEKPHSCEICGKSFRVSYCLTLHMRTHTGARPYECMHCGKRFKAHSVYNHHLLIHSEVRAYKCPFCPKAFKTAVQLAGHKNSHTKPFSCQQCNRPFASLYAVRVHTETHARQNNLKFSCTLCGASYARAFALKDHVKQVHKQDIDSVDGLTLQEDNIKSWTLKNDTKQASDNTQDPNKDVPSDISELNMSGNELIVP